MNTKQKLTAIIYDRKGRILSIGKNSYLKTHPLQAKYASKVGEDYKIFLHAEIAAIVRCDDLTKAHKIVIMRFDRSGNPKLAKPCNICKSAIEEAGIKLVEHT